MISVSKILIFACVAICFQVIFSNLAYSSLFSIWLELFFLKDLVFCNFEDYQNGEIRDATGKVLYTLSDYIENPTSTEMFRGKFTFVFAQ